ncbi:hypothetical protein MKZ24_04965 [Paenibacillus sp. FSL R7-0297]|uniref:hypothetical protein n=1 Tax=Paenibacillus sp. FSL R7-0297 TaxID=2921680 RepID=UPI0030F9FAFC
MPIAIEKFDKAYHERSRDMALMNNNDRKIVAMHLGGIIIECLIKFIVVKHYNIKERDGIWNWIGTRNLLTATNIIKNPSHSLVNGLKLVDPLYNKIDITIKKLIDRLQRPNGTDYIDLRYFSGVITDKEFDDWYDAYIAIRKWLVKNLKSM